MGHIRVDTNNLDANQAELLALMERIRGISEDVQRARRGLTWKISASSQVKRRLDTYSDYINHLGEKANALSKTLGEVNRQYAQTESANARQRGGVSVSFGPPPAGAAVGIVAGGLAFDYWNAFWNKDIKYSETHSVFGDDDPDSDNYLRFFTETHSGFLKPEYGTYKNKKAKKVLEQKKIPIYQVNPDKKWYKEKGTILEASEEAKIERSVVDAKVSDEGEYTESSAQVKVLTGEAHISGNAGLYVFDKDENGNVTRIFSPGVAAEIGTSAAMFETSADGRIGLGGDKNMLGAYGNMDAEVASVEAKGKVAVNRNEIYAGASAEANFVEVSGTAGVSVLGTDVGVTGSLKVGVGAHAEIGITDGKLKVDVGAAVGVGFDIGFEVDISGTVDAVTDACKSVWNFFFG